MTAREHSDAPWRFDAAPSDAGDSALRGHILPHGAGIDDPCVAWIEGVGSALDLALILAAPEMLAALEGLIAEIGVDWPDEWNAGAYEAAVSAIAKAEGEAAS